MLKDKITILRSTSCFRDVGELKFCTDCSHKLIKYGKTKNGKQRYYCTDCLKSEVLNPIKHGYANRFNKQIIQLTKEGLGIRSTARVLGISPATVVRKILDIANGIKKPKIPHSLKKVQVDELHTYIHSKSKEICVIYSWSQELRRVFTLEVGTRSKTNLQKVAHPLLEVAVESINTDGYSGYKGVIPLKKHTTFKRRNNGIERQNLNLRTHLKRLNRRTICYSKSAAVLLAVVKIYFWS